LRRSHMLLSAERNKALAVHGKLSTVTRINVLGNP
jgi:hypothetical protein